MEMSGISGNPGPQRWEVSVLPPKTHVQKWCLGDFWDTIWSTFWLTQCTCNLILEMIDWLAYLVTDERLYLTFKNTKTSLCYHWKINPTSKNIYKFFNTKNFVQCFLFLLLHFLPGIGTLSAQLHPPPLQKILGTGLKNVNTMMNSSNKIVMKILMKIYLTCSNIWNNCFTEHFSH